MADPIKEICKIIKHELDLTDNQIWIYNQKWDVPNDFGTYYVVSLMGQRIIGNVCREKPTANGMLAYQSVHCLGNFVVDLFSRSSNAREALYKVLMAFNSTYAQQVQEANGFQIARNSFQVTNTSEVEGVAELTRFSISFNVTYMSELYKSIDYFDTFDKEVITEE